MVEKRQFRIYTLFAIPGLISFFVYIPTLKNGFINWDDAGYIFHNEAIRSINLDFIKWSFGFHQANWHPLTWVTHALDYAVWGNNSFGHHLGNIIIHGLNSSLVAIFFFILIAYKKVHQAEFHGAQDLTKFYNKTAIWAAMGGLFFGIHPLHVESVAWASERKDLLAAFFFLLSISFYSIYVILISVTLNSIWPYSQTSKLSPQKTNILETQGIITKRKFLYTASIICFALAAMSKPMVVSLPLILFLLDIYPFERFSLNLKKDGAIIIEKIPFILISFFLCIATIMAQSEGGALNPANLISSAFRVKNSMHGVFFYIKKMVLPFDLTIIYPFPRYIFCSSILNYCSAILFISITLISLYLFIKSKKAFLISWLCYLLMLFPVIGIIQFGEQSTADRYFYLPGIVLFLSLVYGSMIIWEKLDIFNRIGYLVKMILIFVFFMIVAMLSTLTCHQISFWKNPITLWTHEIDLYDTVPTAFYLRGNSFLALGEDKRALEDYGNAIKSFNRRYYYMHVVCGTKKTSLSEFMKMVEGDRTNIFKPVATFGSLKVAAYNRRGFYKVKINQLENAIIDFSKAILFDPGSRESYKNRALVFIKQGLYVQAREDLLKAIELGDRDSDKILKGMGLWR